MKLSGTLVLLTILLIPLTDSEAQFTPISAKQRKKSYQRQADGSEIVVDRMEGTYFRSSSGSVMDTRFTIKNGQRQGPGRANYVDSSTGRAYSLSHRARKAEVKQIRPTPLQPLEAKRTKSLGEAVINGLNCFAMPVMFNNLSEPVGRVWWATDVSLLVRREVKYPGGPRTVWELYDIQFAEPDPSLFGFPSDYAIDTSRCMNCDADPDLQTQPHVGD